MPSNMPSNSALGRWQCLSVIQHFAWTFTQRDAALHFHQATASRRLADWPAAVLSVDGELRLIGSEGERWVRGEDFFLGLMSTALKPAELIAEIRFPSLTGRFGGAYFKMPQQASGFAIVGIAASLKLDRQGRCEEIGIGVTGLGAKPFRARAVEQRLRGNKLTPKWIEESAAQVAEGIDPLEDLHASATFRAHLACVLTSRAVKEAAKRAIRGKG